MRNRSKTCQLCGTDPGDTRFGLRPVQINFINSNGRSGRSNMLVCADCRKGPLNGSFHFKDSAIRHRAHRKHSGRHTHYQKRESFALPRAKVSDNYVALVKTNDGLVSLFYFDGKELSRNDGVGKCSTLTSLGVLTESIKDMLRAFPDGDFKIFCWDDGKSVSVLVGEMVISNLPKNISDWAEKSKAKVTIRQEKKLAPKEIELSMKDFTDAYIPRNFTTKNDEGKILYYCCAKVTPSGAESLRQGLLSRGFSAKVCFEGNKKDRVRCVYSNGEIAKRIREVGSVTAFAMLMERAK